MLPLGGEKDKQDNKILTGHTPSSITDLLRKSLHFCAPKKVVNIAIFTSPLSGDAGNKLINVWWREEMNLPLNFSRRQFIMAQIE